MKTEQDGDANESNRQRRRMLADGQSRNDVSGVACLGRARDFLDRGVAHRRVVICDRNHDCGHDQPDDRSEIELRGRARCAGDRQAGWKQIMRRRPKQNRGDNGAG